MKTVKRIFWLFLGLVAFALAGVVFWIFFFPATLKIDGEFYQAPEPTGRVLIVAPHPDDEGVACAGVIQRALKQGVPLKIVLVTNGDGYRRNVEIFFRTLTPSPEDFRKLGAVRHEETIKAMKKLGLAKKNIIFLSYPDGGTNSLWDENWDSDHLHQGLNGDTHSPYSFSYQRKAPYCGENVVKNLETIIRDFKPTMVYYPDPEDAHHDHWATNAFVQYVLIKIGYSGKELTYLVHRGDWPTPWRYVPNSFLEPPKKLKNLDTEWEIFPLSRREISRKYLAIKEYHSQEELMEPFLYAFVRKNELFGRYKPLKVVKIKNKPNFSAGEWLPYIVVREPTADTLARIIEGAGDICSLGFCVSTNKAWLALETRKPVSKDIVYVFHLRLFNGSQVKRVDIEIRGDHATLRNLSKNSLVVHEALQPTFKEKWLWISLPKRVLSHADTCLFNADSFTGIHRIDKTAWRKLVL